MTEFSIYHDGEVHVVERQCSTCVFNPHTRPVDGSRVAELVRGTKDEPGATVPCHHTLGEEHQAICRGWWDRFAQDDLVCKLAMAYGVVAYDEEVPL